MTIKEEHEGLLEGDETFLYPDRGVGYTNLYKMSYI